MRKYLYENLDKRQHLWFDVGKSKGWAKHFGIGVGTTHDRMGTTYGEPGKNESRSVYLQLGYYTFTICCTYKVYD